MATAALDDALRTTLADAPERTKLELRRLAAYRAPPAPVHFPTSRLAAVLVLVHLDPRGELAVTLTTRSRSLRSHPGETALPGGRWEDGDGEGGHWTALREAWEEIGLPLPPRSTPASSSSSHLLYLTTLPAFTSRTLLVVLPVVYLLLHPASSATPYLERTLAPNPAEVDAVFHLPLRAFLMLPPSDEGEELVKLSHTSQDFTWLLSRPYRLHSFTPPAGHRGQPVTGLTADIVVAVALVAAYDEGGGEVGFERFAEGQLGWDEIVREALRIHRQEGERGLVRGGTTTTRAEEDDERTSAT